MRRVGEPVPALRMVDVDAPARARRLVETGGGRFSAEMGIDVDRGSREVERWALAATLFGARIPAGVVVRTFRVMVEAGAGTLAEIEARSTNELVRLWNRAGYARYDYRTALRLKKLAATLHGHCIAAPGTGSSSGRRIALDALPGWGPVTVALFLRELRGVWPDVDPPLDDRAEQAARHLGLLDASDQPLERLQVVATEAGLDLRDLEAGLIRLWLAHHLKFPHCAGGARCFALSGPPRPGSGGNE